MKSHGGKRKRAGKPALYGKPMIRKNVMLDSETIEILKALGGGNLSEGIRKAAEQSVQPTVLTVRHKLVTCPQCLLVFDGNEHATHSG